MHTPRSHLRWLSVSLSFLAGCSIALGQMPEFAEPGVGRGDAGQRRPVSFAADYSATGSGTTEFRGTERSETGTQSVTVSVGSRVPLGGRARGEGIRSGPPPWSMRVGLMSQNVYFDDVPTAPVPDSIHTLSINSGLSRRLDDEWMLMASLRPTLYRLEGARLEDVGVSGALMALWRRSPSLTWVFGVMVNPDGEIPVLPLVGANWRINPEWTLSLMGPRSQLIYRPNQRWSWHAGANWNGATFRTSDTFGTERGEPRYNRALANYRDIRLGTGFEVRVSELISVNAEVGYSVNRKIRFRRIDEDVKFDGAAYFQVGLRGRF